MIKKKSTCGTINPYAGHVASHGHVGHVMAKLLCVISMLDMSWSNSHVASACWTCHGQTPMRNMMACRQHVGHVMVTFLLKHDNS